MALLVLGLLPSLEGAVGASAPTLEVYHLWEAQSHMLCLLCLLLRTEQTRALALACGAGAAVCRTLADALVRTKAAGWGWSGQGWQGGAEWAGQCGRGLFCCSLQMS